MKLVVFELYTITPPSKDSIVFSPFLTSCARACNNLTIPVFASFILYNHFSLFVGHLTKARGTQVDNHCLRRLEVR
jgi:hypothetical protein